MSASFLITWERLSVAKRAVAIFGTRHAVRPGEAAGSVGQLNSKIWKRVQVRLPRPFQILLGLPPSRAGNCGRLANARLRARQPFAFYWMTGRSDRRVNGYASLQPGPRVAGELKNSRGAPRRSFCSPRIQPRKQAPSCFLKGLHSLLSPPCIHAVEASEGVFGNVRKSFGEIRNV